MDRLTKVGEYLDPVGTIDPSIYAKVELENGNMLVHIYQDDEKDDPLESDDCINVEIW